MQVVGSADRPMVGLNKNQIARISNALAGVELSEVKKREKEIVDLLSRDEVPEVALRALERSVYVFRREKANRGGSKMPKDAARELWRLLERVFTGEATTSEADAGANESLLPNASSIVVSLRAYGPHCMFRDPAALVKVTCAPVHYWSWRTIPEHDEMSYFWTRLDNKGRTAILRKGLERFEEDYVSTSCSIASEDIRRQMVGRFMRDQNWEEDTIESESAVGRLMRTFSVRVLDNVSIVDRISLYETEKNSKDPCGICEFNHATWGGAEAFSAYAVDHCQSALRLASFVSFEAALSSAWRSAVSIRDDVAVVIEFNQAVSSTMEAVQGEIDKAKKKRK